MRKADFDTAWAKCRTDKRNSISLDVVSLGSSASASSVNMSSRISAIIGPNGVGKSGLLRGLYSLLQGGKINNRPLILSITGSFRGQPFSISRDADGELAHEGVFPRVFFLDVAEEVHKIQAVANMGSFDDVVAEHEFAIVKERELSALRFICRRNYMKIEVCEIEAPVLYSGIANRAEENDEEVFPFFRITLGDTAYDSRAMGFGELCAFYLLWKLNRIERGSVVLLDEPDSHLSPASRGALVDYFAFVADKNELGLVFSSHSVEAIQKLAETELWILQESQPDPQISTALEKRTVVRSLGMSLGRKLLIVVEDVDSLEFITQILRKFASSIAPAIDVQAVLGGASEVVRFVNAFPVGATVCKCVAILDGDKGKLVENEKRCRTLPGGVDPIKLARENVLKRIDQFATSLGLELEIVRAALNATRFADHHDFLGELKSELGNMLEVSTIRGALFRTLLIDTDYYKDYRSLVEWLNLELEKLPLF